MPDLWQGDGGDKSQSPWIALYILLGLVARAAAGKAAR